MLKAILLFFVIGLIPSSISFEQRNLIVFWNVGQGSWTTLITSDTCVHVDTGGRWRPLVKSCQMRKNYLWFTHYDWDHISLARKIFMTAPDTCLIQAVPPQIKAFKKKFLSIIPQCQRAPRGVKVIYQSNFLENNDSSAFILAKRILITGDATQKMEKKWLQKIPSPNVHALLAGHHGSRTSLSPQLLKNLPHLRMVVVSAEKKKYGHPHKETIEKLRRARVPMIKTEDFGSVALEM
jgi:competence protein ComEC